MDLLQNQEDKSKLICDYELNILLLGYRVYQLYKDLYNYDFGMLQSKNTPCQTSTQLALVQVFYHIEHRLFLYIQANKYNSWFEVVKYCVLHIWHYLRRVEWLYMDFDNPDQCMLVYLDILYLRYSQEAVEGVLEYRLFHMDLQ